MSAAPKTVDAYMASLPEDARATMQQVRKIIASAAPDATQAISYQMPAFKLHGGLVAYAAWKQHCGLYVMNSSVLDRFAAEVAPYRATVGTLRFPIGKRLPAALIRKLTKARVTENEAKAAAKKLRGKKT